MDDNQKKWKSLVLEIQNSINLYHGEKQELRTTQVTALLNIPLPKRRRDLLDAKRDIEKLIIEEGPDGNRSAEYFRFHDLLAAIESKLSGRRHKTIVWIAGPTLVVAVLTLGLGAYEHFHPRSTPHQDTQAPAPLPSSQILSQFLKWNILNVFGLFINTAGAILISSGVIRGKKRILKEGQGLVTFSDADPEQNIKLAPVKYILLQSRLAVGGVILLIFGFLAQFIYALHPIICPG